MEVSFSLPGPFSLTAELIKIHSVWVGHDIQLEKKWLEVREKAESRVRLWSGERLSIKERLELCASDIYPILLYRFSVLLIPFTELILLI